MAPRPSSGAIIIGHSLGCRVLLEAARRDPAPIGRLVLLDANLTGMGERAKALSADVGAGLYESLANWDVEHMRAALDAVRAPLMAIQSTTANAERKRVPLKAGETTPWLDLVRASVPGARIEVIADEGHFPQIERPDDVNRLLAGFVAESSG